MEKNLKALLALFIFFLLDTTKPFSYSLIAEFTFLGVVLICLNYPFKISLFLAVLFGYFKDAISADGGNFNLLEFSSIAILIHYSLRNFRGKTTKIFIFFGALFAHILANNFHINKAVYLFSLLFFMQSSIIFLLMHYLFKQWIHGELRGDNVI